MNNMHRILRLKTYKAQMSVVNSEFYDLRTEDEAAAFLLTRTFTSLVKKAGEKLQPHEQMEKIHAFQLHEAVDKRTTIQSIDKVHGISTPTLPDFSDINSISNSENDSVKKSLASTVTPAVLRVLSMLTTEGQFSRNQSSNSLQDMTDQAQPRQKSQKKDVVLPKDMVPRLVRDVVRMSEGERHGIRGCIIVLNLVDGERKVRLGRVVVDPKVCPSCELHLNLSRAPTPNGEDVNSFPFLSFLTGKLEDNIYISAGYTVEKQKISKKKKQVTFQV